MTQLRIAFWIVAGITGFVRIWLKDYIVWGDTLSYLDSGDLLWRGDFANAITNRWSPGLPFLFGLALKILHPIGLWEVAVVKLVDQWLGSCAWDCLLYSPIVGSYRERQQDPRIDCLSKFKAPQDIRQANGKQLFLRVDWSQLNTRQAALEVETSAQAFSK